MKKSFYFVHPLQIASTNEKPNHTGFVTWILHITCVDSHKWLLLFISPCFIQCGRENRTQWKKRKIIRKNDGTWDFTSKLHSISIYKHLYSTSMWSECGINKIRNRMPSSLSRTKLAMKMPITKSFKVNKLAVPISWISN